MKRLLLAIVCLASTGPLLASQHKGGYTRSAPTATVTITGNPLTIVLGDDTSMQVYNSNVPGTGQFYSPDDAPADAGVWVRPSGPGITYGPCCGGSQPFTPVSLSPVTGTGTAGDPFTAIVVVNVGTALQMTETMTYVNGSAQAGISLSFGLIPVPGAPTPTAPEGGIGFDAFVGADLYLADNDRGYPFAVAGSSAGGHASDSTCTQQLQYSISFLGTTPADKYTARYWSTVWSEIESGSLTNTIDPTCEDDGAALQWTRVFTGQPVSISTGVSFTGQAVPVGPTAVVPTLSIAGISALVVLLAAVGYVLARKTSLGA